MSRCQSEWSSRFESSLIASRERGAERKMKQPRMGRDVVGGEPGYVNEVPGTAESKGSGWERLTTIAGVSIKPMGGLNADHLRKGHQLKTDWDVGGLKIITKHLNGHPQGVLGQHWIKKVNGDRIKGGKR